MNPALKFLACTSGSFDGRGNDLIEILVGTLSCTWGSFTPANVCGCLIPIPKKGKLVAKDLPFNCRNRCRCPLGVADYINFGTWYVRNTDLTIPSLWEVDTLQHIDEVVVGY
jgi:hypothetical protein